MISMQKHISVLNESIPVSYVHTLVLGSGAASLAAAVRLKRSGVSDVCICTDNIKGGTSRNTGSDKQTYYKLCDSSEQADSPYLMAQSYTRGGAVHGDIALAESMGSLNAFYHLIGLGVPFPYNRQGGFSGYKTDHDPQQRGVSLGPYTSRIMVEALEKEVRLLGIPIHDRHDCIKLLAGNNRIEGAVFLNKQNSRGKVSLKVILCDNMIFGLGGPGGLYRSSVYPPAHTGGIGLALEAGAAAVNLTESQYGIASVPFRWNLSGSYQQVIPSYYSTDPQSGTRHYFLNDFFDSMTDLLQAVFLKGYQWPFDPHKVAGQGSSLIDLLIYRETVLHGRCVFMDFRENPRGDERIGPFSRAALPGEVSSYWKKSAVDADTPYERLKQMNPDAVQVYQDHRTDLASEPLRVDVCAQHNNGGLAGDIWWESVNMARLFPVGEVNGSHGVYRPGGSALNAGQVGAFRAAQKIAAVYSGNTLDTAQAMKRAEKALENLIRLIQTITSDTEGPDCKSYQTAFQNRMTQHAAFLRNPQTIDAACRDARTAVQSFEELRCSPQKLPFALKQRHLALAHQLYMESIKNYLERGGGSRGSYLVLSESGDPLHEAFGSGWNILPENPALKGHMQMVTCRNGQTSFCWIPCRDMTGEESWFERMWAEFKDKSVFL